eukprot:4335334-Ditylum_brightwellii.AAC.1
MPRHPVLSSAEQYAMYLRSVPMVDDEEVNLDLTCWGIDANLCFEFLSNNSIQGIAPAIDPSEPASHQNIFVKIMPSGSRVGTHLPI